ncbi:unnamed protein product, partial [Symbiodinium sp. KB8]
AKSKFSTKDKFANAIVVYRTTKVEIFVEKYVAKGLIAQTIVTLSYLHRRLGIRSNLPVLNLISHSQSTNHQLIEQLMHAEERMKASHQEDIRHHEEIAMSSVAKLNEMAQEDHGSTLRIEEKPRYHIDEEVEFDELDELETAVGSENEDGEFMSDGEDEVPEEIPTWSHAVEDGPPKLDEGELEKVDGVSRQKEIERLTEMKVLKEMPEGLFVSSNGYTLGSIDVGDAYLMVEQDGYLEEFGLKSDDGLPALFFKRPEDGEKGMIVLSHVDDMELYASREDFHRLVDFLKGKGLKIKVEGPMDEKEGTMSFLKRGFQATEDGNVEITMNAKYIEGLVEALGLEKAYTTKIPCPADNGRAFQAQKNGLEPLTPELHHVYRKGVGILLYLAPERPDVMYVLKKLSTKLEHLIARKGRGKARHLDVDLLWIQRIDDLKIKPIKGKDNPADLGTKSLTRDKIRKYMLTIGYIGDYLEEGEPVDDGEVDVRMAQGKRKVDEVRLQRIIQAVTMAVLIGLGEAHKEASKSMPESEDDEGTGPTMCIVLVSAMVFMCICRTLLSAAILLKSRVKGKVEKRKVEREEKEKGLEKRKKRRRMSGEGEKILEFAASGKWALEDYEKEVKLLIREECRSIEATTAMERWLKEISREQFEHPTKLKAVIKESNKTRQDEATPESRMMMRLEVTLRRALTVMTIKAKEQESKRTKIWRNNYNSGKATRRLVYLVKAVKAQSQIKKMKKRKSLKMLNKRKSLKVLKKKKSLKVLKKQKSPKKLKKQKIPKTQKCWTRWKSQDLENTVDQTDSELETNLIKRDGAKDARETVLTRKAEAELKRAGAAAKVLEAEKEKIEADKEIAEYDEIIKGIGEERAQLKEGRKTVREQLRAITGPEGETQKKRLFPEEERQESAQVQILRMMMSKRKSGLETPRSIASEDGSQKKKKRARGTDRPNEPANPPKTLRTQQPKIKPEAKVAPDILEEKASQQERKDRKRDLAGVPDKWLKKEGYGGFDCFHCGSDAHKAFACPNMLDEAKSEGAEQLPQNVKRLAGCWLFCRLCFRDGKGFNITDQEGKKRIAIGWGSHTVPKCRLNDTGVDPSRPEKMPAKKAKGDGKVIDVEEEEKKKESKGSTGERSEPNIFTTPEGQVIPNAKWCEETMKPKVEEKKMPKKKEITEKEKKDKKEKKEKKEKKNRAESPEKYSERDLKDTE